MYWKEVYRYFHSFGTMSYIKEPQFTYYGLDHLSSLPLKTLQKTNLQMELISFLPYPPL